MNKQLTQEETLNLLNEAHKALDRITFHLNRISKRSHARINYHLRNKHFRYTGTMIKTDGKPYFLLEGARDIYINLEPYCYEKINTLLKQGKIQFKNDRFIIID